MTGDVLPLGHIVAAAAIVAALRLMLGHRATPAWMARSRKPAGVRFWSPWRFYLGALAVAFMLAQLGDAIPDTDSSTRPAASTVPAVTSEVTP